MKSKPIIAQTSSPQNFTQDVISAVDQGYTWGISVLVAATAAILAVSLVAYLIHRTE